MSICETADVLADAARRLDEARVQGAVPAAALQTLFAAVVRAYGAHRDGGGALPPFPEEDPVSATDVARAATAMLEAADMAVFELGMWQMVQKNG